MSGNKEVAKVSYATAIKEIQAAVAWLSLAASTPIIDAQIAILSGEARFCEMNKYSPKGAVLDLARAILAEATS